MLDARISVPATRTTMQLDLRPFHAALARTTSVLDVLEVCEATAMPHGAGMWIAACITPCARTYVAGPTRVRESDLHTVVEDMNATLRTAVRESGGRLSRDVVARWRDDQEAAAPLSREYAQNEVTGAGTVHGLLRVTSNAADRPDGCDWETVESVMCAAAPHILLCLQREAQDARADPLTGLCTPDELRRRADQEVERARAHPVELSLVMAEVSTVSSGAGTVLTDVELSAVGQVVRETLRRSDAAARMPDGRFVFLLPMTSQRNALIVAARITDRLRAHPVLPSDLECRAGVSGWAFEGPGTPELFTQAGEALECAKSAGARGAFVFL